LEQVSGLVVQPYVLNSRIFKNGVDIYEKIDELKQLKSAIVSVEWTNEFYI